VAQKDYEWREKMDIHMEKNGNEMTVTLEGRLDTASSPTLEKQLADSLGEISHLTLEFEKLNYISSAGLRVLLSLQKKMTAQKGKMVVRHPNEMVLEVFSLTGFDDILTIEK